MTGIIDRCIEKCSKWDLLLARVLVGGMFVFAGLGKFMGVDMMVGYMLSVAPWVPMPTAIMYLVAALEVIGGLALISGFYFRYGALALACFTVVVTALFHTDWSGDMGQMQMTLAMKNGAILGALLYMKIHGPGPLAFGGMHSGTSREM